VDVDPPTAGGQYVGSPGPNGGSLDRPSLDTSMDGPVLRRGQLDRLHGTRFATVVQLAQTTSTNSVLMDRAAAGAPEGLVVVADYQSAGRGRFDRRWESPPGKSLLFSVLLRPSEPELPPERRHLAVAAVSLALVEGAKAAAGAAVQLKWPNDLVFDDRKLAGVLTESAGVAVLSEKRVQTHIGGGRASKYATSEALVVGAGVNVGWAPQGQAATDLATVAGRPVDRGELLVASLTALDRLYGRWDLVSRRYRAACATVGREVVVQLAGDAPQLSGKAVAVDEQGRLLVSDASGALVTVAAGDVVHLRPAERLASSDNAHSQNARPRRPGPECQADK
jgi:BirA family transcriptional regulator, biotin operon repressor / biotin---[acetyl-CoA-carboxylase] ligase